MMRVPKRGNSNTKATLQTVAEILVYIAPDTFELPYAGVGMLADEANSPFMLDNFEGGVTPEVLDGVQEKLLNGCLVADVGCGDGAVTLALAKAYPNSQFHAFDPNSYAVARVIEVAKEMQLENVAVSVSSGEDLPKQDKYDQIQRHGTWFIKDNLRNPVLAMMYGFSIMSCMSSAMSSARWVLILKWPKSCVERRVLLASRCMTSKTCRPVLVDARIGTMVANNDIGIGCQCGACIVFAFVFQHR